MTPGVFAQTRPAELPPVPESSPTIIGRVNVKGFRFEGNRAISSARLAEVAQAAMRQFTDRRLTLEQLEQLCNAVTAEYVRQHYVNSGAVLPDQSVADGIVTIRIIEGRLGRITFGPALDSDHSDQAASPLRLNDSYIRTRLELARSDPLNTDRIERILERLRHDPNIQQVNGQLRPSPISNDGADLDVLIREAPRLDLTLVFSNRRPPPIGPETLEAYGDVHNVTGFGDTFSFRYDIANGDWNSFDFAGDDDFSLAYTLPIAPDDTTLTVSYERSDDPVIEAAFQSLGLSSKLNDYELTLDHPLRQTNSEKWDLPLDALPRGR